MSRFTVFAAFLALALFAAPPSFAQTARPFDLAQLTPEVRASVEAARAAQTRALMAAARSQADGPGHIRFTGTGGDTYNGECNPCGVDSPQRHGVGLLSWPDGEIYAGEHMRGGNGGFKHGHGVYTFMNGTVFEGEYSRDQYSGYGVFWAADGQLVDQGRFVNGELVR